MNARRIVAPMALLLGALGPGLAWAAEPAPTSVPAPAGYELRGATFVVHPPAGEDVVVPLGCDGVALLVRDQRAYVACGSAGVVELVLQPSPAVSGRRVYDGAAVGFFVVDGAPWVRLAQIEARPLDAAAPGPAATVAPAGPAEPALPAAPALEILERHPGRVIVGVTPAEGLARGDRVEIYVERAVDLGGGATGNREERVAVGVVAAFGDGRAEVELGLGERVPEGARARMTALPKTASRYAQPRLAELWDLRFAFRPFLALGTVGFGMVDELSASYRFEAPVAVHLMVDPAGVGVADVGNILALAGNVVVTYDSALFEVGLGLGWSAVNGELGGSSYDAGSSSGSYELKRVKSGFSLAQLARLGATDGLNFRIFNDFLLYDDEFHYGGTRGVVQIPLDERLWLVLAGGGGSSGYAFGEIGLRVLVAGNGDHGTLLLTPTLGGAGLFGETEEACEVWNSTTQSTEPGTCTVDIDYAGPMVGIILEYRP